MWNQNCYGPPMMLPIGSPGLTIQQIEEAQESLKRLKKSLKEDDKEADDKKKKEIKKARTFTFLETAGMIFIGSYIFEIIKPLVITMVTNSIVPH